MGNVRPFLAGGRSVAACEARLAECEFSEDYVAVVTALVAGRKRAAVPVLAALLDSPGVVGAAAAAALVTLSAVHDVVPSARWATGQDDYDAIRTRHTVLARLGHLASVRWLRLDRSDGWWRADGPVRKAGAA
jgi:hypothetical protein